MSSAPSPPLILSHWLSLVNVVSSSNYMTSVLEIRWPFCRILRHKFSSGCSFFQQPSQLYWRPERKSKSLVPSTQSRPADIYLTCWKRGRPAALDVTVISTLQQSTVRGAAEDQVPRRESLLPTVLPARPLHPFHRGSHLLVRNKLHGRCFNVCLVRLLFQLSHSVSVEKNNPASSALPIVVAPPHTTPQLSQSQPVTSPVALNESDSSARVHAPPSEHPPQLYPPPSILALLPLQSLIND